MSDLLRGERDARQACPKGEGCALSEGAVHCFHCGRNWPPDETWAVPGDARQQAAARTGTDEALDARRPVYDAGLFVSDLPSAEWIEFVDGLLARVQELTDECDEAHGELTQAHANIDQLLAELKRGEGDRRRVQVAERALRRADKIASKAHDAMWEMDFEKTSAGRVERQWWTVLRKQASDEIHKLHAVVRPVLQKPAKS